MMSTTNTIDHIGRKISRIRELRGMKQESLAIELGVSQQTVSNIEKSAAVESELLAQVANILGVTPDAIKNFSEDSIFNVINNFHENSTGTGGSIYNGPCTFNPLEKLLEAQEENKKLYERLLDAERSKVAYLEQLLGNKIQPESRPNQKSNFLRLSNQIAAQTLSH